MRCAFRPGPKFLAMFPSCNARRFSVRAEILGDIAQFKCEASFTQPKPQAAISGLNARRFSVRTKVPGGISESKCEAFFGQKRNPWRYLPVWMRGVFRWGPKFLAVSPSFSARCFAARARPPGDISQFEWEVRLGQTRDSWQ